MNKKDHETIRERREIQARKAITLRKRRIEKYTNKQVKQEENKGMLPKILLTIAIIVIVINFIRATSNNNITLGFKELIQALQTLSNTYITIPSLQNLTITADWGVFEVIKNALNTIINIIDVLLFICNNLINLIIGIMNTIRILIFS